MPDDLSELLSMSLALTSALLAQIHTHAESAYPHECCGAMIGRMADDSKTSTRIASLQNAEPDSPERRFVIDPGELNALDRQARKDGQDIVGFYHSHPDSPAWPSTTDLEWAWPAYSYLIVSVVNGESNDTKCYALDESENEKQFVSEQLIVNAE